MRRTPGIEMIAPRIRSRLDCDKTIAPFVVGEGVAASGEVWVERCIVLVVFMQVSSGGIGLPRFDYSAPNRLSIFVQDSSAHDDSLTHRLTMSLLGEIAAASRNIGQRELWTHELSNGLG